MTQIRQIVRRHHCEAKKKNASRDLVKAMRLETKLTFHIKSASTVLSRSEMKSLTNKSTNYSLWNSKCQTILYDLV